MEIAPSSFSMTRTRNPWSGDVSTRFTSVVLPLPTVPKLHHLATDPLQRRLIEAYQIEVPVMSCSGRRILRLSCQQYTTQRDLERLVDALEREVTQMPH